MPGAWALPQEITVLVASFRWTVTARPLAGMLVIGRVATPAASSIALATSEGSVYFVWRLPPQLPAWMRTG